VIRLSPIPCVSRKQTLYSFPSSIWNLRVLFKQKIVISSCFISSLYLLLDLFFLITLNKLSLSLTLIKDNHFLTFPSSERINSTVLIPLHPIFHVRSPHAFALPPCVSSGYCGHFTFSLLHAHFLISVSI
jgi:hypothetical protein